MPILLENLKAFEKIAGSFQFNPIITPPLVSFNEYDYNLNCI